jgi:hypothetical protein
MAFGFGVHGGDATLANTQALNRRKKMRASMLALAGILVCFASVASAQAVIDVEGLRAAQPPVQDQPAAQPQPQLAPQVAPQVAPQGAPQVAPQVAPQATPQPTPKAEAQPKDDGPASPAGGRFTFNRIDNGYLRLDTQNGQVAYCRTQTAGWSCQIVPENRSELDADVARLQADIKDLKNLKILRSDLARLQDEIAALRREVAALKEPSPPRPPADLTSPDKGPDVTIRLPTHEDLARARAFVEKTWHRLVEMITAMQKDVLQKG